MHNGYIENFRSTLMRQIRDTLRDEYYAAIGGSTDSEHVFALFLNFPQCTRRSTDSGDGPRLLAFTSLSIVR
jgi:predicted glutamine amidotransferase